MTHNFTKGDIVGVPMWFINDHNKTLYDPYKTHDKKLFAFDIFIVDSIHITTQTASVRSMRLNNIKLHVSAGDLVLLQPVDIANFKRSCKNLTEDVKALMELGNPFESVGKDRLRQLSGLSNN